MPATSLFDATTGTVLAVMDGSEITTAAPPPRRRSRLRFWRVADARRLLVVGAGRVVSLLPEAMTAVRSGLDEVLVWNRRSDAAAAVAASQSAVASRPTWKPPCARPTS